MGGQIKNIQLKFQCDVDWDSMEFVNGIKHCNHCKKNVYDFTDAKQYEFLMILAENNNNICGRFLSTQLLSQTSHLPTWKKWLSAAVLLLGINIFNNKAAAQTKTTDTVKEKISDKSTVFGGPETVVSYPGGDVAFRNFITSHLRYTEGMKNGRVIITFTINKDGTLSNFKILRGLGELNDKEALRVLKLSPKWSHPLQAGKPLAVQYTASIIFNKGDN